MRYLAGEGDIGLGEVGEAAGSVWNPAINGEAAVAAMAHRLSVVGKGVDAVVVG